MTTFTEATAIERDANAQGDATNTAEAFHIDSDAAAEWLLRKLSNIAAEQARVTAQAAEIVRQLDSDRSRLRALYESELIDYARRRLAAQGNRRRTLTLLQGSVYFRTVPASVKVADTAAALDYCQEAAPAPVSTVRQLDTEGYRNQATRHYQETGELLPGVESTPEHESVKITSAAKV